MMDSAIEMPQDQMETPPALQRLWSRRMTITSPLPEETELGVLEDFFPPAQDVDDVPAKSGRCSPNNLHLPHDFCDSEHSDIECQEEQQEERTRPPVHLNAATLGDFPAHYVIPALKSHEFPAVGVYVDPRIVPGFRYRVRPIQDQNDSKEIPGYMFNGRALPLLSIGRGYSRRLTFQPDVKTLNDNNNYFWTDSRPEGFAFELEVVSPGDKFTLHDANHVAAGTLEILQNQAPHEEVSQVVLNDGSMEKTAQLRAVCKVEWFDNGQSTIVMPIRGLAVAVKPKGGQHIASVTRVVNVTVGAHQRGFMLTPGVNDKWRRITVAGEPIGDVPTRYTITGLESHELPVIGTYVDPRIMPGFNYRVRPAGSKKLLFGGRSLRLVNVGLGYGKRITFEPDQNTLNAPNNFLWSDSHPDGLGFEPRAVHAGMKFTVTAAGQRLGEGSVFRADAVQQEEKQELVKDAKGTTVVKYIHIDVTCHITLDTTNETREPEPLVMRVSGTAVVARGPRQSAAQLIRIENIGLASQLNLLFVTQQAKLVFHPL